MKSSWTSSERMSELWGDDLPLLSLPDHHIQFLKREAVRKRQVEQGLHMFAWWTLKCTVAALLKHLWRIDFTYLSLFIQWQFRWFSRTLICHTVSEGQESGQAKLVFCPGSHKADIKASVTLRSHLKAWLGRTWSFDSKMLRSLSELGSLQCHLKDHNPRPLSVTREVHITAFPPSCPEGEIQSRLPKHWPYGIMYCVSGIF
jgi:hypothetical protein